MILLTSDGCAPCKVAKQKLDESGLQYEAFSVDTEVGKEMAINSRVRQVPALIHQTPMKDWVAEVGLPKILEFIRGSK